MPDPVTDRPAEFHAYFRAVGMLSLRLLVSAILIPLVIALFVADLRFGRTAPIFGILAVGLGAAMASEMVSMYRQRYPALSRADVIIVTCAVIGIGWACHGVETVTDALVSPRVFRDSEYDIWSWIGGVSGSSHVTASRWFIATCVASGLSMVFVTLMSLLWLIKAIVRIERGTLEIRDAIPTLAVKMFIIAYVGGFTSLTAQIRWLGNGVDGMLLLATIVIATKSGDVGAYFTGRFLGRKHVLPKLSPKKTGAGFLGAPVVGGLACLIWLASLENTTYRSVSDQVLAYWMFFGTGAILALIGALGDLAESLIKRSAEVKDASNVLPGFGGVLDLLDSIIFTGALAVSATSAIIFVLLMYA